MTELVENWLPLSSDVLSLDEAASYGPSSVIRLIELTQADKG